MTGDWPDASIDHQNRVKDDNHWDNLRKATMAQNIANTGARATSKSGVKGVSWCKTANKWRAAITVNGKQRSLGRYSSLEDAARAYQEAASEIHGAYAATELGVTFYDLQEHA